MWLKLPNLVLILVLVLVLVVVVEEEEECGFKTTESKKLGFISILYGKWRPIGPLQFALLALTQVA